MLEHKLFNSSHPDWDRFHHLAKYGHSGFQYFLAAHIIASEDYPNRRVEAYKWASLAVLLGESFAEEIPNFLRISMSEQEVELAFEQIEDWYRITAEAIFAGEDHSHGWSTSVMKMFERGEKSMVNTLNKPIAEL
jgi:hypothetical protein